MGDPGSIYRRLGFIVAFSLLVGSGAAGQSATQLILTNDACVVQVCVPHPPPPKVTAAGASFGIYVVAAVADRGVDPDYRGTVSFSSSDPIADLPSPYTFLAADEGDRGFTAVLRTPGQQTITVSDVSGNPTPGTLTMIVTGPITSVDVPTLTEWMKVAFLFLLGWAGVGLCRKI